MPSRSPANPAADTPFCSACGYDLSGAVSSASCPECGRPLVEVLRRRGERAVIYRCVRKQSSVRLFGLPVYSIALGPDLARGERVGRARGIIAVGDVAVGGIALGGMSSGVVALGGLSVGLCTFGGLSVGLLTCFGGGAVGGFAVGGAAVGGVATGGLAIGYIAQGGRAIGEFARGQLATGPHVISQATGVKDPAAVQLFRDLELILGAGSPGSWIATSALSAAVIYVAFAALIGMVALAVLRRRPDDRELRFGPRGASDGEPRS